MLVRDMTSEDEYFVSTCSHVNESDELNAAGCRRQRYLTRMIDKGLRVKVAVEDDRHLGFIYTMPIESSPWGPIGVDLLCFPCLWVLTEERRKGAGKALLKAAEEEAVNQGKKGIVTTAYYHDFWFMAASYFEQRGYQPAARRNTEAIMWKVFDSSAAPPAFFNRNFKATPVEGKVVIDLFYTTFCLTSDVEAERVRQVAAEFGDRVILNEISAEDAEQLIIHQIPRAIFINGKEIYWGYEAPKDGIREAIQKAL